MWNASCFFCLFNRRDPKQLEWNVWTGINHRSNFLIQQLAPRRDFLGSTADDNSTAEGGFSKQLHAEGYWPTSLWSFGVPFMDIRVTAIVVFAKNFKHRRTVARVDRAQLFQTAFLPWRHSRVAIEHESPSCATANVFHSRRQCSTDSFFPMWCFSSHIWCSSEYIHALHCSSKDRQHRRQEKAPRGDGKKMPGLGPGTGSYC